MNQAVNFVKSGWGTYKNKIHNPMSNPSCKPQAQVAAPQQFVV